MVLFVGVQVLRNQLENGRADHLLCRISENTRGSRIPTGDDAIQVLAQNHVVGGFDDRSEFTEALGTILQRLLTLLDLRDVPYRAEDLSGRSIRLRLKLPVDLDPTQRLVRKTNRSPQNGISRPFAGSLP